MATDDGKPALKDNSDGQNKQLAVSIVCNESLAFRGFPRHRTRLPQSKLPSISVGACDLNTNNHTCYRDTDCSQTVVKNYFITPNGSRWCATLRLGGLVS
jgi:hypothetical protein